MTTAARTVTPVWVLGLTWALLACGSSKKSDEQREPEVTSPPVERSTRSGLPGKRLTVPRSVAELQKPPALPQQRTVTVSSAGATPRVAARYQLDPETRDFTITAELTTREFTDGAWSERMALPQVSIGLGLTVASRTEQGATVRWRGLSPVMATPPSGADARRASDAMNDFLARYRGFLERRRGSLDMAPDGVLGKPTLTPDAALSADASNIEREVLQLLLESVVRLPAEPVGVGARWHAVTLLHRGHSVVKQTARYQLLAVDGRVLRIGAEITQIGEHQVIAAPGLPPGHVAELVALFWQAKGEVQLDLAAPVPVAGNMATELRVHGRLIKPDGKDEYSMETIGTVSLRTAAQNAQKTSPAK